MKDLSSTDSTTKARAEASISNLYYGGKGLTTLLKLIDRTHFGSTKYFEIKSKLIAELGYIREAESTATVVKALKEIYDRTADTSTFQNQVFKSLAKHRSKESYSLLKKLLLEEPPAFESTYEYGGFFRDISDSLQLAKALFPEILQHATVHKFK